MLIFWVVAEAQQVRLLCVGEQTELQSILQTITHAGFLYCFENDRKSMELDFFVFSRSGLE